ncbi:hypothetical protein PcPA57_05190 [Pasteurella canis]|uniref:helix-turn-helix domain-containing protein n=1 Tax=Pasteurella canis TaxID=753 RepID=UPI001E60D784|nr:helix-turn-helix transcriptional regulator [Pasteurella canis]GJJ79799.1 hypothetical protein PcPA57_05190 [Pasteurella canis]
MSISERLKLVCQEKNWKLKDFSEATGLPYRTAQGYLNGTREPNAEGMSTLCNKINLNINWLLTGKGTIYYFPNEIERLEYQIIKQYRESNIYGKKVIELVVKALLSHELFILNANSFEEKK